MGNILDKNLACIAKTINFLGISIVFWGMLIHEDLLNPDWFKLIFN